jgi:hypothetical protein
VLAAAQPSVTGCSREKTSAAAALGLILSFPSHSLLSPMHDIQHDHFTTPDAQPKYTSGKYTRFPPAAYRDAKLGQNLLIADREHSCVGPEHPLIL